jgi:hypothetical protein
MKSKLLMAEWRGSGSDVDPHGDKRGDARAFAV